MDYQPNHHLDLSSALIANALDTPFILDIPEIAKVSPDDMYLDHRTVWKKIKELHAQNNLSTTSLVASFPNTAGYDLYYFNQLRDKFRGVTVDDLMGVADSLWQQSAKERMKNDASWLASQSANGAKANDIAREMIQRLTPVATQGRNSFTPLKESIRDVYNEIELRFQNPSLIWGIPYPYYPYLGKVTGGKQKGELTLFAGEPKVGKSWWVDQDAMGTAINGTPTAIWSGEMKKKQIARRLLQLQGLNGRRSKTGYMTQEDWETLNNAVEVLERIPLYVDDSHIHINEVYPIFMKLKNEFGVEHVVLDYAFLIGAEGKTEIEKTQNVSREVKRATQEADLSCTLITSVNKMGMDAENTGAVKSNIRGSGQQIHDADMILMLTKFAPVSNDPDDLLIKPDQYDKFATLHIAAGRELDETVPGGCIHYKRENGNPFFQEWKREEDSQPEQSMVVNWTQVNMEG